MPNKCEWTTEVVSDEFDQMRESSRMFWVINVVGGNYELTGKFDNTGFPREGDQVGSFGKNVINHLVIIIFKN